MVFLTGHYVCGAELRGREGLNSQGGRNSPLREPPTLFSLKGCSRSFVKFLFGAYEIQTKFLLRVLRILLAQSFIKYLLLGLQVNKFFTTWGSKHFGSDLIKFIFYSLPTLT